jgi:L-ascorbate metabolism protein UlaG (beta-lactamase superfamily)
MNLTYLGHSCILLETGSHRLLFDPFLSESPTAPKGSADTVEADFILLSHGHDDHVGDALKIAKRCGATVIANYELASYLGEKGAQVHPMYHGGKRAFPFGEVKLTIAHHGSGYPSSKPGEFLYMGAPAGLLVTANGKTVYHAGDTGLFLDMQLIGQMHAIDHAFLPIGDNFTMGVDDAAKAVEFLKPKAVTPIHYNTWPLISADPADFARKAERAGSRPVVLQPGQSCEL